MKTFYEHQESARGTSAVMMMMLTLAISVTTFVAGLMITLWLFVPLYSTYLVGFKRPETAFTIHLQADFRHPMEMWLVEQFPWMVDFPWELFFFFYFVITAATGACLIVAMLSKMKQLREAGGVGLADSLGGVCVTAEGYRRENKIQRAVNLVDEIAIASRVPRPHVYLLNDENGINSFAVGLNPEDMVIGLTSGAVNLLSREQLQAMIAHEFSHIKTGDTRTNIKLVGYLHGLMCIIICAQSLIDQGVKMLVKSISHGGQGIVGMATTAIGVLLWPVGLAGLGFATLIKAAYCRQREYLADANAIEYARNLEGLSGTMKRILGCKYGSRIRSPRCFSISHTFFARSIGGVLGLVDSHPPLEKRLRRVDKDWDGEEVVFEEEHDVGEFKGVFSGTMSIAQQARAAVTGRILATPDEDFSQLEVGDPVVMGVNEHAAMTKALLPTNLWQLTQDLPTAEAMVFALWAIGEREAAEDDSELCELGKACEAAKRVADALKPHVDNYGLPERLMLFDAAVNLIRQESQKGDLEAFCRKAEALLDLQNDGDLFRWAWKKTVRQIVERERAVARPKPTYRDVDECLEECELLLSALAYANGGTTMQGYSLLRGANVLGHDLEIWPEDDCGLHEIEAALERLQLLAPKARRKVVLAGSACIETDGVMNEREALLMRGICSGLGYPPATLLPGQPVKIA